MKKIILFVLCLVLLTGCTSPAADPTEPYEPPVAASDPVQNPDTAEETVEPTQRADPIIVETQPPTEPPEPLPQPLYLAEKCQDLLDMDYPVFVVAGTEIIKNEFIDTYAPAEDASEEERNRYESTLLGIPYLNTYAMDLNLSKEGELLFTYSAPTMTDNKETTVVLDLKATGWEQMPTTQEAYIQLLELAKAADGAYAEACEWMLSTLLQDDPDAFSKALSQRPEEEITNAAFLISMDFFYSETLEDLEQIANALSEENVKTALLETIGQRRG